MAHFTAVTKRPFLIGRLLTACLLAVAATAPTFAQRTIEGDEVDQSLSRKGSVVKRWVSRPNSSAEDAALFKNYFENYYFPSLTLPTPEGLGELADLRNELFRQYITPAAPEIQKQLTEQAYAFARRVIRGRTADDQPRLYHRAVKYNAVLVLGGLGTQYARDGLTPLPAANELLSQILALAAQQRLPGYMQAGALVGLADHARSIDKLPADNQDKTILALMMATKADGSPQNTDKLTRNWFRSRAARALATAAMKVNKPEIAVELTKLVGDSSLTLDARVEIAASFQGLTLPADGSAAKAMLRLASEIGKNEATQAIKFEELQIGIQRSSSATDLIKSKRYRFDQLSSRVIYLRAGLVNRLEDLKTGLQAASASAGDSATAVQQATAAVNKVISIASNQDSIDLDVSAEIRRMAATLQSVAPEEVPEEKPDPEPPAEQPAAEDAPPDAN